MTFRDLPIRRKVMAVIMLTSVTVLVLTVVVFMVYDWFAYRGTMARNLGTTASMIAEGSTAVLGFQREDEARKLLARLKSNRHIRAAALYDAQGKLFARYPDEAPERWFPAAPEKAGHQFAGGALVLFQPAYDEGQELAGTVFLKSDLEVLYERQRTYGLVAVLILCGAGLVALGISSTLQRHITGPIRVLADAAEKVSGQSDYSVRAEKVSGDELGLLTDAFNLMLTRIQEREAQSKQAQKAVRESEARKSAVLESALDCVITMDQGGRIVDFNPAAEKTFGHRREEVIGKSVAETIIPPRMRQAHMDGLARYNQTGEGPVLGKRIELPALRADGSEFPAELAITSTPLEGGAVFFTAYLRDITERKRAEESLSFLAAIVESSDDAVVGKDMEGRVVSWNAGAERMFGYTAAEMLGQPVARLLAVDRPDEEVHLLEDIRRGQTRHFETVRMRKGGQPVEISMSLSPIRNVRGEVIGFSSIARDITERKRAERELQEGRARLSGIIGSAMDAIISVDANQRITIFNEAAVKMFGCPAAQALGQPLDRFIPARFREAHRQHIEAFGSTGVTSRTMGRLGPLSGLRANGEEFPIEASISQIETAGQKIYTVILRDITERLSAQERIEQHMTVLREQAQMLELANVLAKDLHDRIILWNAGMEALYGWSKAEALGKIVPELLHTRSPQPLEFIRQVLFQQGHWEGELVHVRKDGRPIHVASQWVVHTDAQGRPVAILEVNNDITERKRAEERQAAFAKLGRSLSAAASASAAARVIADIADEVIGWDACSLHLYLAERDLVSPVINIDTLEGKRVDVPAAVSDQEPSPIMRRVLEEGAQLILREEPYEFAPEAVPFGNTGRPSASLMYVPVRLRQAPIGILSIQSYRPRAYTQDDLSTLQTLADQCAGALERVRAEEKVRQLAEELEQRVQERTAELIAANQELEAFTYSVAHDLRAPLRHIDAFTRILHDDFTEAIPAEAQRYLENIRTGSRHMSHLVDDLLNLARVGRQELKRLPTPLSALVHEVLTDLKRETEGRTIEWRIQPLPTVECDAGLMRQVFANLLANAVKYTRPRPVAVIEVGCQRQAGDTAVVVRDNGVGFSMKYVDKLFGVFQRLHRAEEFEGTGVGLATVARILRKHGGRIWAEAELDKGAAFYFTLPGLDKSDQTG